MVISSKGRYALRVMVDLAEHGGDGYVSMRDVARRQEISDKYAGQIMILLSRAGLVDGVTGKGGGYRPPAAGVPPGGDSPPDGGLPGPGGLPGGGGPPL